MSTFIRASDYTGEQAWAALPVLNLDGVTVNLHWTDQPYHWHVNDGEEVFAVLDGKVAMHYREQGQEHCRIMEAGDIFVARTGCEHVAHPQGPVRVLVVEREGSE